MRRKTEAKRQQIMQAAATLFSTQGYADTSLEQIAKSIGSSKITIYGYFDSKAGLLKQILLEGYKPVRQALALSLVGDTLAERLRGFCREQLRMMCVDYAVPMVRLIISEVGRSEIGDLLAEGTELEAWDLVEAEFAGAIDAGQVSGMSARQMMRWLKAMIRGDLFCALVVGERRSMTEDDIIDSADGAVALLLNQVNYRP